MQDKEQAPPDSNQGSEPSAGQSDQGQAHDIPPEGSLGLLALGAVGITEWRYARERARRAAEAPDEDPAPENADQQPPDEDE